ncbi:flagellar hook-basal body complex protein FliE [bacterium]|nr:flagellar hook-basal body complex protein FliE [bacterium]
MLHGFNNNHFTLKGRIDSPYMNTSFMKNSLPLEDTAKTTSFKDALGQMATSFNKELNAPDKLLSDAINGNGDVDIHDVTTAMAKAEMSVSLVTQVTSKVVSAYEKITQISV